MKEKKFIDLVGFRKSKFGFLKAQYPKADVVLKSVARRQKVRPGHGALRGKNGVGIRRHVLLREALPVERVPD
jgi:hypothetical protein